MTLFFIVAIISPLACKIRVNLVREYTLFVVSAQQF